jgi:hypothetical protein
MFGVPGSVIESGQKFTRLIRFGHPYTFNPSKPLSLDDYSAVIDLYKAGQGEWMVETLFVHLTADVPTYRADAPMVALAILASVKDARVRKLALDALVFVNSPDQLLYFAAFVDKLRGWSPRLQAAIKKAYFSFRPDYILESMALVPRAYGWAHRDVVRMLHGFGADLDAWTPAHRALFAYLRSNVMPELSAYPELHHLLRARWRFSQEAGSLSLNEFANLISSGALRPCLLPLVPSDRFQDGGGEFIEAVFRHAPLWYILKMAPMLSSPRAMPNVTPTERAVYDRVMQVLQNRASAADDLMRESGDAHTLQLTPHGEGSPSLAVRAAIKSWYNRRRTEAWQVNPRLLGIIDPLNRAALLAEQNASRYIRHMFYVALDDYGVLRRDNDPPHVPGLYPDARWLMNLWANSSTGGVSVRAASFGSTQIPEWLSVQNQLGASAFRPLPRTGARLTPTQFISTMPMETRSDGLLIITSLRDGEETIADMENAYRRQSSVDNRHARLIVHTLGAEPEGVQYHSPYTLHIHGTDPTVHSVAVQFLANEGLVG